MAEAMDFPRVSFGIIVLNGEPFTRYCLKSIYPFAHQILVVEGAVPDAKGVARADGHSSDGTLEALRRFQETEDPEGKVRVIRAEDRGHPDGFWPGEKHEMSRAYADEATGDWLWQVDIDEFYHPAEVNKLFGFLNENPRYRAVSFPTLTFWGGFDYLTDGWHLRGGAGEYHRLFRWGKGYRYESHRPPTVLDDKGVNLYGDGWLPAAHVRRMGVWLYHYSLLFPKQVREKSLYYSQARWATQAREAEIWAKENYEALKHPFRVHNVYRYPSWLERFRGEHPPAIEKMRQDLEAGLVNVDTRPTADVEKLLQSPLYIAGRAGLKAVDTAYRSTRRIYHGVKRRF